MRRKPARRVFYKAASFFSLAVYIVTFNSSCHAEQDSGLFLQKKKGYRLMNNVLRAVSAKHPITCAHFCMLEKPNCRSFNFIEDTNLVENCELNSKAEADASLFISRIESTYFEKIDEALPSTCSALKSNKPETPSGYYTIQPNKNKASFTVFCNMTYKDGIGVTVFGHDTEEKMHVKGYESKGAYSRVVTYHGVSMEQIENVVNASLRCEQFIRYDCKGAGLYFSSSSGPDSWWVSHQGDKMAYWGGATRESKSCACGMTDTCHLTGRRCNCDGPTGSWYEDSGFLVDKQYLPVNELRFGDTGDSDEEGYHALGSIPAGGPMVGELFSTAPGLNLIVYDFHWKLRPFNTLELSYIECSATKS